MHGIVRIIWTVALVSYLCLATQKDAVDKAKKDSIEKARLHFEQILIYKISFCTFLSLIGTQTQQLIFNFLSS